jgi:hypothetical protein
MLVPPIPVVLFEAAVLVAEQQQGCPTRERADHLKKRRVKFVKFLKRKIHDTTRNGLHEKMENEKAFKLGKLDSEAQPLERGVEGEVGGPHTSLIPVQFRHHKGALKLYMD